MIATIYTLSQKEQATLQQFPSLNYAPAPRGVASCGTRHDGYICTLMGSHIGPHIAHGWNANISRVWTNDDPHTRPKPAQRRTGR